MPGRLRLRRTSLDSADRESLDEDERRAGEVLHPGAPSVRGVRTFHAVLPSGRVAWLRLSPGLAGAAEANHFGQAVDRAADRSYLALRRQSRSIVRLARRVDRDSRRLTRNQLRGDRRLRRLLLRRQSRLELRASTALAETATELRRLKRRELTLIRRLQSRAFWDQLVLVSALPLFAAYGQRGSVLASNNVALTLLLLVWLLGDEAMDLLSGRSTNNPRFLHGTDIWSYLAPLANLATGYLLFNGEQHERLVSGTIEKFQLRGPPEVQGARLVYTHDLQVPLIPDGSDGSPPVAPAFAAELPTLDKLPIVASVVSFEPAPGVVPVMQTVAAGIEGGTLIVTVFVSIDLPAIHPAAALTQLKVAWVLDTRTP